MRIGRLAIPDEDRAVRKRAALRWLPVVVIAFMLVAGTVAVRVFGSSCLAIAPPCPFRFLTGLHCPGCGSGRALYALANGDLASAWAMNKLAVASIPLLLWLAASPLAPVRRINRKLARFVPPYAVWAIPAVIVLYWVLRNVPCYPFTLLAPQV